MSLVDQVVAFASRVATEFMSVRTSIASSRLLSVKDYGAKGDDSTDDTVAIQNAINACSEGGTVFFPVGKYRTTAPLYPKRGVTLKGEAAPRWSYTFVPQSYLKIRSTFSGAAAIHLRDMELAGASVEMGNVRIIDLCLDGSAQGPTPTVDGILATGQVRDVRLQNLSVRNFSNAGIHTVVYVRADTKSYFPRGWEMSHVVADTCGNQGFSHNNLDDSFLTDCLAVGNKTDGFYLAGLGEDQVIGCRAVFNKNHGFHVTGSTYGSTVFAGCTTDRNEFNGVLVDATGKLPILFSGCSWRRDGRNGNGGGGGYAAFRGSSATVPIVISAMNTMTGQDDDATGTMSPQYALRIGSCTAVQMSSGYLHGNSAAVQDDGSNTNFYVSPQVTFATGSANSPTITRFAANPTVSAEPPIAAGTTAQYWRGDKSWVTLDKAAAGLGNVDNTSDALKPVSNAQAAINAVKADLVGGLLPSSQIPALALVDTVVVASQAAMLALTTTQVQKGDLAVRTDGAGTFVLNGTDPSVLANWVQLNAPTDAVISVNGLTGTVVLAKGDVGLGNVDNTSDANKPVSTAQAAAIALKESVIAAGTTLQYWRGDKSWATLDKSAVGLSNVDNTSDAAKPVSTLTQTALDAKEPSLPTGGTTTQYLRGDKSWAPFLSSLAPFPSVTSPNVGTGVVPARENHQHGYNTAAKTASTVPSSYPLAVSMMNLSADTSWPDGVGIGHVVTIRYQALKTVQMYYTRGGIFYTRTETSTTDVWSAWFVGEPAIATTGSSLQFLRGDKTFVEPPNSYWKQPVRACSRYRGDIASLSGTLTVDGVALVAGDRVLVADQTTASQNGIYVVAAGAWTRAPDANSIAELLNAIVPVSAGTNAGSLWSCTVLSTAVLGTDTIGWTLLPRGLEAGYAVAKAVNAGTTLQAVATSVWTVVQLDSLAYQSAGGGVTFSSGAAAFFTIPRTGFYQFTAGAAFAATAGTSNRRVMVIERFTTEAAGSGNQVARQEVAFGTGVVNTFAMSGEDFCSAGDKVRAVVWQNSTVSINLGHTTFPGYLTIRRMPDQ